MELLGEAAKSYGKLPEEERKNWDPSKVLEECKIKNTPETRDFLVRSIARFIHLGLGVGGRTTLKSRDLKHLSTLRKLGGDLYVANGDGDLMLKVRDALNGNCEEYHRVMARKMAKKFTPDKAPTCNELEFGQWITGRRRAAGGVGGNVLFESTEAELIAVDPRWKGFLGRTDLVAAKLEKIRKFCELFPPGTYPKRGDPWFTFINGIKAARNGTKPGQIWEDAFEQEFEYLSRQDLLMDRHTIKQLAILNALLDKYPDGEPPVQTKEYDWLSGQWKLSKGQRLKGRGRDSVRPELIAQATRRGHPDLLSKGTRRYRGLNKKKTEGTIPKLTSNQVNQIRRRYKRYKHGGENMNVLAEEYGVSSTTIRNVILKRHGYAD